MSLLKASMNRAFLLMAVSFVLAVVFAGCSGNLQGQAATTASPQCTQEICGDDVCASCESCTMCPKDCCPIACADSDGGKNAVEKGTLNGLLQGKVVSYEDACKTTKAVMEYYCSGPNQDIPTNELITCNKIASNYLCQEGACVPSQFS
jgi:hypothetical protein